MYNRFAYYVHMRNATAPPPASCLVLFRMQPAGCLGIKHSEKLFRSSLERMPKSESKNCVWGVCRNLCAAIDPRISEDHGTPLFPHSPGTKRFEIAEHRLPHGISTAKWRNYVRNR